MRAAALLMAVLMLTAGCLGFGGDDETEAEDNEDTEPGDTEPSQNGSTEDGQTGDGPGEHEHEPERERHWDNKTGEVEGTNVIVDPGEPSEETTDVPEEALEFSVTLSTNGSLQGEVYPPGCEEESDEPGEDCSHTLDGDGASYQTDDPDAGTWTIRLWKAEPSTEAVPYTLEIWFAEEHEPAPGHHS